MASQHPGIPAFKLTFLFCAFVIILFFYGIDQIVAMQDYDTLLEQISEILNPLVEPGTKISEESDFVADLGFDSLKVMKLLEKVEDRYDISIPLNILPDIHTIKDFVVQLQRLMNP